MGRGKFIFFLAWRNVLRYRKRSLQSFLILFCGTFCVMLVDAYMRGYAASSTERIVSQSGHLDIHAAGYLDSAEAMPLDLSISDAESVMGRALRAAGAACSRGVRPLLAPSIETGCMLSNGETSRAAVVYATESFARSLPGQERELNPLLRELPTAIVSGHFYRSPLERGALLDEKYARKLGLGPGDSLILLGNDAYGSFSMMETPVIGLVREASLPSEAGCLVDMASFAPVFGLEGKATAISLWFASGDKAALSGSKAEAAAVRALERELSPDSGLEIRPFSAISASYTAMFEFLDVFLAAMMAVFAVVASVGITNAILLSVQERVKDLGTLRAIALSSRQAGYLVYAETLITGLAASIASLALGALTIWIMQSSGFGIRFELSDMGSALPDAIRPGLFPSRLLVIAGISAVFPILAALIPARAAQKLTIRESLCAGT
jgi:putative ABC transport system permease protein